MMYANIKHDIIQCNKCPLHKELTYGCYPQWGTGSSLAKLLVINLKSYPDSHLIEKPLDTKSSIYFKKLLEMVDVKNSEVFVTNLVKCTSPMVPKKRFRTNAETCKSWIDIELRSLTKICAILCLGEQTLNILLNEKKLTKETTGLTYNNIPLFCADQLDYLIIRGKEKSEDILDKLQKCKVIMDAKV